MSKKFVTRILITLVFLKIFVVNSFAVSINENTKINNIENLKLLQELEAPKAKTYSYEINKGGIYFEPEAISQNQEITNNNLAQNLEKEQSLNYNLRSNIGYEFNKYFTGFVSYDLGNIGIDSVNRNVNLGIDYSTIRINGVGSKINFSDDFGMKIIYREQDLVGNGNLNIDKSQEINLKTILNF